MKKYHSLQEEAYEANRDLSRLGLAPFTFGNASAFDHGAGVMAIKPSGVPYEELTPKKMVLTDLEGKPLSGRGKPSSDTLTHVVLYKAWPQLGGIVHTHSRYATAWAQARRDIPILGTTHADHLTTDIPCAPPMDDVLIQGNYERQTGHQILREFERRQLDHEQIEMILLGNHAPFTWGSTVQKAVLNSAILECIAEMAWLTLQINPGAERLSEALIRKHFERKHGPGAYYGQ